MDKHVPYLYFNTFTFKYFQKIGTVIIKFKYII